jgi:hypothetical protein
MLYFKNNFNHLLKCLFILIAVSTPNYETFACGENTQGGKRLCPALQIEGNKNPCIGSTETYKVAPYSTGDCVVWNLYGGVIVELDGQSLPMPYQSRYSNSCSPAGGFHNITVKWGYDEFGNLMNPLPTYGYLKLGVKGIKLVPLVWGCDGKDNDGKETDFGFNFAATPVQSIGTISGNANPSCGWQTLTYSIPVVTNDATYTWTIPSGWVAYTSLSGKYLNTIQVRTNGTPPSSAITGGNISVLVTQPCGPTLTQTLAINGNAPVNAAIGGPTQICSSNPINIPASITGGTQPYNYQWSITSGSLSCTNCASPVYTPSSNQNIYNSNLSLTVTDAKGCVNSISKSISTSGFTGWIGGFVNPNLTNVKTVKTGSNLTSDNSSNIYYTGSDGKIYYFYFDVISNQWLVSAPIATNSVGPTAIYEPVSGQKVLYYINNSTNNAVYKIVFDGTNWGTAFPINIASAQNNLAVDQNNGILYYKDQSNNLAKYDPATNAVTLLDTQIGGQTIIVSNSEIYYFKIISGNSVLYKTDVTGTVHTQLTTNYATPNSTIAVDNVGNVYFADWNNLYVIKKNGSTYLAAAVISNVSTNGYFSINTATNVIYYTTYDQNIYQCFNNGQSWVNVKTTSEYYPYSAVGSSYGYSTYPASNIIYKAPHAFYIDVSNNVSNLFYYTGCTPQYQRSSSSISNEDYLPDSSPDNYNLSNDMFKCYPNPFTYNTNINYTVDEISPVKISVNSIWGNEVCILIQSEKHDTGTFNVNLDGSQLTNGIYICNYYKNNVLVKTNKLIVQK